MEIQDRQIAGVTILAIQGTVDALTAPRITEYIQGLISSGNIRMVADFSGVSYISSAGLRMLLGAVKQTRSNGGDLFLVDIRPDVEKVLRMSGFTSIMKIFPDIDSAVNEFS